MHALKSFLASLLRGGHGPRHIFTAIVLGFTAGAVGGWNLTFAAFLCAAVLLNCSTSILIVAGACGYLAAFVGSGFTRSIGVMLLDQLGLSVHLAKLGTGPFSALFGLDDYATLGSLAAGLAISIPLAQVFSRFATHRRSLLNLTVAQMSVRREPIVRPLGWAAACSCAMAAAMLVQMQTPRLVGRSLLEHLSAALQTDVTADVVAYDLWNGDLQVTNLRIADPEHPSDVALVVEEVSARVEPGLMLRGRFACNDMNVAGIFCDPTKLSQAAPVGMFSRGPTLLKEDRPQPSHNEDPLRAVEIQGLVRNWSGVCDRLLFVQRIVGFVERIADLETSTVTSQAFKDCVGRRRAQRDKVSGTSVPLVQVRQIKVDRLPSSWKLGTKSGLSLTDLSSCPSLASRPAKLTFKDEDRQLALNATFQLTTTERRHDVTLEAQDLSLESVLTNSATRSALEPQRTGTTSLAGHGWISRELLDVGLTSKLEGLQVASTSGPLAGIDAGIWRQGLERLGELQIDTNVAGRWSNPKLTLVPGEVVQQFKKHLQTAGARELVLAFDTNKASTTATASLPKAVVKEESTPELKPTVPPYSTTQAPQPAPALSGTTTGKQLSSGVANKPAALTTAANTPSPPMQPFTIQPTMMTRTSAMPTNIPTPADKPTVAATTSPAVASQPAPAKATVEAPAVAALKAAPTAPPATAVAPPATTAAQTPVEPIKTLPSQTFAVATGQPWKEPSVVLGNATPVVQRPLPPKVAQANRSELGTASDDTAAAKSAEAAKPAVAAPQEIASQTFTTTGLPQAPAKPKGVELPTATAIPTSADVTAGLRQPRSVLDPSAAPGPINLTVGYDSDRVLTDPAEGAPKKPNQPSAASTLSGAESKPNLRNENVSIPPSGRPLTQDLSRERTTGHEQFAAKSPNTAARPPIVDDYRSDDSRYGVEPNEQAPKEKKSILTNVTGWFGIGPKPERTDSVESTIPDSDRADRYSEQQPSPKSAPAKAAPAKKMFPRLRAMFGEEVETLPADDAEVSVDRGVVPSNALESDAPAKVRPSSFDASQELKRVDAAPADFTSTDSERERAKSTSTTAEPRALNIPRTNTPNKNEAKPLPESVDYLLNAPRPKAVLPRPTQPTLEETSDAEAARKNAPLPTAKPATRPTERMSAGESFYNRTVR
ncbi:MAG: hypothetical protein K8U03_17050 [Planctomycetia bacterium]|nr:hypothetical protein [Planctomycetia bacterium]